MQKKRWRNNKKLSKKKEKSSDENFSADIEYLKVTKGMDEWASQRKSG